VAASVKQDLREKKRRALKSYYAALNLGAQFEKAGNMAAVAEYELIMAVCLYRLQAIRFQEIVGDWPQLLPAQSS
jgi:hypothetical protein